MNIENITLEGRKVGYIVDGIVYVSPRKQSKHLYRGGCRDVQAAKKAGKACWGVSKVLLDILVSRGIQLICIDDAETKKAYYASVDRIIRLGSFLNFDNDLQKFISLSEWKVDSIGNILNAVEILKKRRAA